MKLNQNTEIKLDLKTVVKLITITAVFVGMYYTLESDIQIQENHINELKKDITNIEAELKVLHEFLH